MSTEQTTPAAAPSGPISLDQFVAEMDAEQAAPAVEEEDDEQPEQEAAPVAEDAEDDIELELGAEEDEPEAEPEPIPDPPVSWSKEDRDAWADLTPKAREVVLRRERDRDVAVSRAAQTAAELNKRVQGYAAQVNEFARLGSDAFEARWQEKTQGPIDWASAMRRAEAAGDWNEFDTLQRNKALYDAEKAEVERAQKAAAEQSRAAHQAFMAEEYGKLPDVAPELVDPKTGEARRKAVAEFLITRGIEPEAITQASAAELAIASLALDGLKYREAQARAKQATTVPRKNPVVAAPKPVRPVGSGDASPPQRNLQALSQKLTRSGKIDDFVALMDAEQEQKTKKAQRR